MLISDLNVLETVEATEVIGGTYDAKAILNLIAQAFGTYTKVDVTSAVVTTSNSSQVVLGVTSEASSSPIK